jgi:hypothetical protein
MVVAASPGFSVFEDIEPMHDLAVHVTANAIWIAASHEAAAIEEAAAELKWMPAMKLMAIGR